MACVVGFGFSSSGFLGDSLVAMGLIGCYVVVVQACLPVWMVVLWCHVVFLFRAFCLGVIVCRFVYCVLWCSC